MAKEDVPAKEIDFIIAAGLFECGADERKEKLPRKTYYDLLNTNKESFINATTMEMVEPQSKRQHYSSEVILRILRAKKYKKAHRRTGALFKKSIHSA